MTTLAEYIDAHREKPFKWGENDCVLFAIGWLNIATDRDWLAEYPKWSNEREALRILKTLGGIQNIVDSKLKQINPHTAKDGDVGFYGKSLMLFSGRHIVGPGENGLIFVSRIEAGAAWCA